MKKEALYYLTKQAGARLKLLKQRAAETYPGLTAKIRNIKENPPPGVTRRVKANIAEGELTPADKAKLISALPPELVANIMKIVKGG